MPVELYLKITNAFIKYYRNHKLSSKLCCDVINALIPICKKAEAGEYDMKKPEVNE